MTTAALRCEQLQQQNLVFHLEKGLKMCLESFKAEI